MKYQKSTTPACKDVEIIENYNLWRFFFCVFYVTYKVSKKAALALVYKPQWKCDSKKFVVRFRFYWISPEGFYFHWRGFKKCFLQFKTIHRVIYIPLEGFKCPSKGFIISLEGFRCPSWGFIFPLEGFRYPSLGFIIPLEGLRCPSWGVYNSTGGIQLSSPGGL